MATLPPGTPVVSAKTPEQSVRDKQLAADSARAKNLIQAMMARQFVQVSKLPKGD